MTAPRATVVVPVYNTEAWLGDALASIDRQPDRATIEVVVVDDGSTDASGQIARDYAQRAPGVRYVRQDNAGLGAARNHGVRLATGDYLAFLDSDDLYPADGLHHLITRAQATEAPIAVGDMHGFPPRPSPPWRAEIVGPQRIITSLAEAPLLVGNPSACNKVFRREFVGAIGATFTEGSAFEDVLFTVPLLLRAPRIALSPHLVYLYRQRGNGSSIMDNRFRPVKIMQHLAIIERLVATTTRDGAATVDSAATDGRPATGVDPGAREAVYRWVAYMQLAYAGRAADNLDDAQLDEFTKRMSALLGHVPVPVAAEYAPNPGAGLRAVALYDNDPAGVRHPRHHGPVRVVGGQLYLDHPAFDRYRELLRVSSPGTTVDTVRRSGPAGGERIRLTGRCVLPGPGGDPGQLRDDLVLDVGDTRLRRPLTVIDGVGPQVHWQVEIPLAELPRGRHLLRVVARDRGAELVLPPVPGTPGTRAALTRQGNAVWVAPGRQGLRLIVTDPISTAALTPARWGRVARFQARRLARRGIVVARVGRQRVRRLTGR
ncbi:glycosyltransferase family 2 protein [Solwaraspora sp. WMMD406]|uniref:glycosyltransferase family 2 protein n=1 Tax=Solwaraspora sp. WMMD406 TaxID=3016095 RepID=UPI00241676A6|nr:glycosyltransferase family 2 protein [Solwaraspora sp. WMMD406]MDG4762999.1 glycosyltransferase family 2 protein [Solwaraspora sp. WMMD406]